MYAPAFHALNLYRINYELQVERHSLIEGNREHVRLDSSLIPLESSHSQEDDEIMGITIDMIQKDVRWHNAHSAQTIRNLENLQSHLFNQRPERSKYYGNLMDQRLNQSEGQENVQGNENWKSIVKWNATMSCLRVKFFKTSTRRTLIIRTQKEPGTQKNRL